MPRSSHAPKDPSSAAAEAIQRVGIECRLVIIQHLLRGPLRFHELQRVGIGVDAKTLSRVLRYLVDEEIVRREVLQTRPVSVRYSLTEKGQDLRPVVDALSSWGQRWIVAPQGALTR